MNNLFKGSDEEQEQQRRSAFQASLDAPVQALCNLAKKLPADLPKFLQQAKAVYDQLDVAYRRITETKTLNYGADEIMALYDLAISNRMTQDLTPEQRHVITDCIRDLEDCETHYAQKDERRKAALTHCIAAVKNVQNAILSKSPTVPNTSLYVPGRFFSQIGEVMHDRALSEKFHARLASLASDTWQDLSSHANKKRSFLVRRIDRLLKQYIDAHQVDDKASASTPERNKRIARAKKKLLKTTRLFKLWKRVSRRAKHEKARTPDVIALENLLENRHSEKSTDLIWRAALYERTRAFTQKFLNDIQHDPEKTAKPSRQKSFFSLWPRWAHKHNGPQTEYLVLENPNTAWRRSFEADILSLHRFVTAEDRLEDTATLTDKIETLLQSMEKQLVESWDWGVDHCPVGALNTAYDRMLQTYCNSTGNEAKSRRDKKVDRPRRINSIVYKFQNQQLDALAQYFKERQLRDNCPLTELAQRICDQPPKSSASLDLFRTNQHTMVNASYFSTGNKLVSRLAAHVLLRQQDNLQTSFLALDKDIRPNFLMAVAEAITELKAQGETNRLPQTLWLLNTADPVQDKRMQPVLDHLLRRGFSVSDWLDDTGWENYRDKMCSSTQDWSVEANFRPTFNRAVSDIQAGLESGSLLKHDAGQLKARFTALADQLGQPLLKECFAPLPDLASSSAGPCGPGPST